MEPESSRHLCPLFGELLDAGNVVQGGEVFSTAPSESRTSTATLS